MDPLTSPHDPTSSRVSGPKDAESHAASTSSAPSASPLTFCDAVAEEIVEIHKALTQGTLGSGRASLAESDQGLGFQLEKFLERLAARIDSDPQARAIFEQLEQTHPSLIEAWKNSAVWKGELTEMEGADSSRREVSKGVIVVVEKFTADAGISPSIYDMRGTVSKNSDLDYNPKVDPFNPKAEKTALSDNAALGVKSSLAYLVWQAKFHGSANDQADVQFMPSQVAQYFVEEANPDIMARARLSALWIQATQNMPPEMIQRFNDQLIADLRKRGESKALVLLKEILNDIKKFEDALKVIIQSVPEKYRELPLNIFAYQLSLKMEDLALRMEKLPSGKEREDLAARYYFLSALRGRFLPGAYLGEGTFGVACQNVGSQLAQRKDEAWDRRFTEEGQREVKVVLEEIKSLGNEEMPRNKPPLTEFQLHLNNYLRTLKDNPYLQEDLRKMSLEFVELVRTGELLRNEKHLSLEVLFQAFSQRCYFALMVKHELLAQNKPIDLLESAIENAFCYCHSEAEPADQHDDMAGLVQSAKYGKRFFDSAYQFVTVLERDLMEAARQKYIDSLISRFPLQNHQELLEGLKGKSVADQQKIIKAFIEDSPSIEKSFKKALMLLLPGKEDKFMARIQQILTPKEFSMLQELPALRGELKVWTEKMNVLEAAKRTKWDKTSFFNAVEQMAIKESNNLLRLRAELKNQKNNILSNDNLVQCATDFVKAIGQFYELPEGSNVMGLALEDLLPHRFDPTKDKSDIEKIIEEGGLNAKEKLWDAMIAQVKGIVVKPEERKEQIQAFVENHFSTAQVGSSGFAPMGEELRVAVFQSALVNQGLCIGIVSHSPETASSPAAYDFKVHDEGALGLAKSIARVPEQSAVESAEKQKKYAQKLVKGRAIPQDGKMTASDEAERLSVKEMQGKVMDYGVKIMGLAVQGGVLPIPSTRDLPEDVSLTQNFLELITT